VSAPIIFSSPYRGTTVRSHTMYVLIQPATWVISDLCLFWLITFANWPKCLVNWTGKGPGWVGIRLGLEILHVIFCCCCRHVQGDGSLLDLYLALKDLLVCIKLNLFDADPEPQAFWAVPTYSTREYHTQTVYDGGGDGKW